MLRFVLWLIMHLSCIVIKSASHAAMLFRESCFYCRSIAELVRHAYWVSMHNVMTHFVWLCIIPILLDLLQCTTHWVLLSLG